jgi:hypothetical protein
VQAAISPASHGSGCAGPRAGSVALGALQPHRGERLDLQRLQHDDADIGLAQISHHAAFVAAGGLDADAPDTVARQPGGQVFPAGRVIGDGDDAVMSMHRDIELVLRRIDSGGECVRLNHLR